MSETNWQQVEAIIDKVLELPEHERLAFINTQCKDEPQLKGEVTKLLESIFDSEGWLENLDDYGQEIYAEIADDVKLLSAEQSLIGKEVGSYIIKEKTGEGGMGLVYLAERARGFDHKVAIKIIKSNKTSEENIQRFKREQRILAGLNHPGIARLFDAGSTENGTPYIIMEYVDGCNIIDYCKKEDCTLDQKIELFTRVLEAIRYAHENLIIHRDLKPANILVDPGGNIKILDFGISKLLEKEENDALTKTGARLLTPRYAAPEQIRQQNTTTATDLYALGIIFYQLLADEYPFDFADLSQYEIGQAVLHQETVKPSSKALQPKQQKKLQGDLDAIALKALRKEAEKRYRVANEFLEDLRKYREGLPVSARQDSFRYRSHKFLKRHKRTVIVAAGILLLIIGLSGFYTWRIAQERDQARFEAKRAEQIKEFTFQIFSSANPELYGRMPKDITATALLKSGIQTIDQKLQDEPGIYAELMASIGYSLQSFGEYKSAITALEKGLEKSRTLPHNNLKTAHILMSLANVYNTSNNTAKAKELLHKSINILQSKTPEGLQQLGHSYSKLGFSYALEGDYAAAKGNYLKADTLYNESGAGNDVPRYNNLRSLAEVQIRLEDYDRAEVNLLKVLRFYETHFDTLNVYIAQAQSMLGDFYSKIGQYNKANTYLAKALGNNRKLWGEENETTAGIYGRMALNYRETRDLDKALEAIQKDIALTNTFWGADSYRYSISLNNLALIQSTRKEFKKAKANYNKAISINEKLLPPNHPSLAISYYNYGDFLSRQNEYRQAIKYFEKAVAIDEEALGVESVGVAVDNNRLASALVAVGEYARADSLFTHARTILQQKLPKNHKRVAENLVEQGKLFMALNRFKPAKLNFEQALAAYKTNFDNSDSRIIEADSLLTVCIKTLE